MRRTLSPDPNSTAELIRRRCPLVPTVGLVLGSGFAPLADTVVPVAEFAFRDLPGFPVGAVPGHQPRLLLGHWQQTAVAVLRGRAHYYEGFDLSEVTFPTRVLAALGVTQLLLTNAAGAINRRYRPGDFMVLSDHINGLGANPLRGPVRTGQNRFVDLTQVYDPELQQRLLRSARAVGARVHSGVYLAVSGPSYETPAEIRAFRRWGADAVGMSTVPEAIVARQCGVQVAGLSCLTNAAAGLGGPRQTVSHEEVLAMAQEREQVETRLVETFLTTGSSPLVLSAD